MVVGITLMKMAGTAYYSPTFARGGLAALFGCEVLQVAGGSLDIDVEHKNMDDTVFTSLGTFTTLSTATVGNKDLSGIKEQVRFKYTVSGANAYSSIHFNMLAPAWRPY